MTRGWKFTLAVLVAASLASAIWRGLVFDSSFDSFMAWAALFLLSIDTQERLWGLDK